MRRELITRRTTILLLIVSGAFAGMLWGCDSTRERFLLDVPLPPLKSGKSQVEAQFVLPRGAYICSLVILPKDGHFIEESISAHVKLYVDFHKSTSTKTNHERGLSLSSARIAESHERHRDNIQISLRQQSDLLPYPWTNLYLLDKENTRTLWTLYPSFTVPDESTAGYVRMEIEAQEGLTENETCFLRIERFFDG